MKLTEYAYLFCTDLARIPYKHNFAEYEKEEPGYGAAWLKAYIYALNTPKDTGLTADLIKEVHRIAMAFDPKIKGGLYKEGPNNFSIYPYQWIQNNSNVAAINYSASPQGVEELIDYWFVKHDNPPLALSIILNQSPKFGYVLQNKYFKAWVDDVSKSVPYNNKDHLWILQLHFANIDTPLTIDPLPNVHVAEYQKETNRLMEVLIKDYNTQIKNAGTGREKIKVIVTQLQRIEQLHPFIDGNIRTLYILLNKLLRDNNLSMCLVMNPNRLDGCSIAELVDMVEQGQIHFQQLLNHTSNTLVFEAPKEQPPELQSLLIPKEKMLVVDENLVQQFLDTVLQCSKGNTSNVSANPGAFFNEQKIPIIKKLIAELKQLPCPVYEQIITELNLGKVNLALRLACRYAVNACIIHKILEYKAALVIDTSEKSSNGNGPIEWLKENKNFSPKDGEQLAELIAGKNLMPNKGVIG